MSLLYDVYCRACLDKFMYDEAVVSMEWHAKHKLGKMVSF